MNTRLTGIFLIFSSLAVALNSLLRTNDLDAFGAILLILWSIGAVGGLFGLIRLKALGSNAVARAIGFLPMLGFFTIILIDSLRLAGLMDRGDPINNTLTAIGWVGILAGMLVVGIMTIAAKTWHGWQRFVPLSTIVVIPIALGFSSLISNFAIGGMLIYLPWVLLGYVIASPGSITHVRQGVPA